MVETLVLPREPRRYILNSIQALRAFAALSVMIGHLFGELSKHGSIDLDFIGFPWAAGVDIFFVISGFVMVYTNYEHFGRPGAVSRFVTRRIIRIVPLYYFFTSLMIAVVLVAPSVLGTTQYDPWQFVTSYLFFPYERYDGMVRPVLSLGWTLNYEMFFYAIFACCLLLPVRAGVAAVLAVMAFFAALKYFLGIETLPFSFWFSTLILEFCFGVLLGFFFVQKGKVALPRFAWMLPLLAPAVAFVALGAADMDSPLPNFIRWGVPAALFVGAVVFFLPEDLERSMPRVLVAMGDSSYALYLAHRFIFGAVVVLWTHALPHQGGWLWALFLVSLIATVGGAHLVHLIIEKPLIEGLRRLPAFRAERGRAGH
ncbi:MAG: acyltransferase [Parvibaculum sp.]|nr:acyltransferase [Parvibaculum sp.]